MAGASPPRDPLALWDPLLEAPFFEELKRRLEAGEYTVEVVVVLGAQQQPLDEIHAEQAEQDAAPQDELVDGRVGLASRRRLEVGQGGQQVQEHRPQEHARRQGQRRVQLPVGPATHEGE